MTNSELVRARLGSPQKFNYSEASIQTLDIYRTSAPNAPIRIYVHGGEWRMGSAFDSAFSAETCVNAGAHFVVPDFVDVTQTGGDLTPMVEQVRHAIAWVHRNAAKFGGDNHRI
ncbi:hypothetical protein H8A99_28570 [Bradyrhizobium sp. Arg68]|uniref:alpha/beta hydrolase n=1 Tax=Bradyrhizobium ivorense TaxID=2511166 RepID=UPI001E51DDA3|nr:hypothetical protein [Bradyrhizobium ivorense]MCC8940307.1 hypothetical protein [Bradyrhizobium ivorense]